MQSACAEGKIPLLVIGEVYSRGNRRPLCAEFPGTYADLSYFALTQGGEKKVELNGEQLVALLRDYIEPLTERGWLVRSAAKGALS